MFVAKGLVKISTSETMLLKIKGSVLSKKHVWILYCQVIVGLEIRNKTFVPKYHVCEKWEKLDHPGDAGFWPARDHNGWRHPPDNKAHSCKRGLMSRYWSSITDAAVNVEISIIQGECKKNCRIILLTICRFYRIKVLTLFILNIALELNLSIKVIELLQLNGFFEQGVLKSDPL